MSISPKDLADIWEETMSAFDNGGVAQAAQHVGGRVISGLPPVTRNAPAMTEHLAGGGPSQYAGAAPPGFSIPNAGGQSTVSGLGTKGRPITVDFSNEAAANLAKHLASGTTQRNKLAGAGERFLGAFHAAHAWGPLAAAGRRIRGMFSGGEDEEAAPAPKGPRFGAATRPAWLRGGQVDLINQRLSQEAWDAAGGAAGGAGRTGTIDPKAARRMQAVQAAETFNGIGTDKGFSNLIRGPGPAPSAPAGPGMLGQLSSLAGGIAGGLMAFTEVAAAATGVAKALHAFAEATVEGNRHLAKWSGGLAVAMAELDIGSIRREAQLGAATGGSAGNLAGEYNKLQDEFQPIAEDLATIKNVGATVIVEILRGVNGILKVGHTLVGPILRFVNKWLGGGNQELPMAALVNFLTNQDRLRTVRNPNAAHGARAQRPAPIAGDGGMGPAAAMAPTAAPARVAGIGSGRGLASRPMAGGGRHVAAAAPAGDADEQDFISSL